MERSTFFQFTNGPKALLPFSEEEYKNIHKGLRKIIFEKFNDVDAKFTNDEIFEILKENGISI